MVFMARPGIAQGRVFFYHVKSDRLRGYICQMNTFRLGWLCVLVAGGCYGGPVGPTRGAEQQATISGESAKDAQGILKVHFDQVSEFGDLAVSLLDIKDSRCPTGANCFWAGEVTAVLSVACHKNEQLDSTGLELTLPIRGNPTTGSVCGYLLELISAAPYPKDGVTIARSKHVVEIRISPAMAAPITRVSP